MTKTLPWFAFQKMEAQVALSTMTGIERGIWVSLLTRCSVIGYLEPDLQTLRVACGVTPKYEPVVKRVLETYFVMDDGVFTHPFVSESNNFLMEKTPVGKPTLTTNDGVGKPTEAFFPLKSKAVNTHNITVQDITEQDSTVQDITSHNSTNTDVEELNYSAIEGRLTVEEILKVRPALLL